MKSANPPQPGGRKSAPALRTHAAGALVLAALTAGCYFAGVGPLIARHQCYVALGAELASRRLRAAEAAASLAGARDDYDRAARALAARPLQLRGDRLTNTRLARVAALAAECGVRVDEVRPGRSVSGPHFDRLPLRVAGSGSYAGATRFLHRLAGAYPGTAVAAFDLTAAPGEAPAARFSLALDWYTAPASGAPADAGGSQSPGSSADARE